MDEFRVFTINDRDFPDPKRMNKYLHDNGFHSVYMIDPGVKVNDLAAEAELFGSCFETQDQQMAMTAFVSKTKKDEFTGK